MKNAKRLALPLCGLVLAATAVLAAPGKKGDVRILLEEGHRDITGKEAEAYHVTNAWLEARMREAESVRVGSTYADVVKHFKGDGGVRPPTTHRFVSILCPFLKIDVEFEQGGVKARDPVDRAAKVTSVSKPYFEPEYSD